MIPFLLTALALQGASPAAAPTFHLEVPAIQELVTAYDQAPIVRLLRDEEVKAFLGKVGVPADFDPKASCLEFLDHLPEGVDAGEVRTLLSSLKSLDVECTSDAAGQGTSALLRLTLDSSEHAGQAARFVARLTGTPEAAEAPVRLAGLPVWCKAADASVLFGLGDSADEAFHADAGTRDRAPVAALGSGSGTTILEVQNSGDLLELVSRVVKRVNPQVGDWSKGVPAIVRTTLAVERSFRVQMRGDRFVLEAFCAKPGSKPDAAHRVQSSWLRLLPPGVVLTYHSWIDVPAFLERWGKELPLAEELRTGLTEIGATLGNRILAYAYPLAMGTPRAFACVELRDPQHFLERVRGVFGAVAQKVPGLSLQTSERTIRLASGEKRKVEIHQITLPQETLSATGPLFTLSPSFALLGERLLVGTSSTEVKKEVERMLDLGDAPAGSDALAVPGFSVPEDATSLLLFDWNKQIESLLGLAGLFLGFAGEQVPFQASDIPKAAVFDRYFHPTFSYSRELEGGTYFRHETSFGPETWLLPLAVIAQFDGGSDVEPLPAAASEASEVDEPGGKPD